MKLKRTLKLFIGLAALFSLMPLLVMAAPPTDPQAMDKVEPALLDQLTTETTTDFVVVFAEQADLSPAYEMDWAARGQFVYNTLKATAERSQANATAYLDGAGLAHHTFIAGNELYVWAGNLDAATALASLPEVARVRATRTGYVDPIVEDTSITPDSPDALAWGIIDAKGDQFWNAFTLQGDGIVVANIDTGVEYTHSALDQSYKCGSDGSDPACWEDPSNICAGGIMCDNNGHGTHTMGTMVGDDDPSLTWQAGMAPNAQWIACKGCETNSCSDFALEACADWILAPNGDPNNRPHVVNNSWGGGGCDNWYLPKVSAWRAAGIYPAFSAGNSTGCGSLGSPGDYQESFGTTGHDSSRIHAYAQGPSCYGHEPYTKPNISAPAVSVCSSIPGNSWSCAYGGTSMASPHSAGAVALLWSCNPSLIGQINLTFEALQNSADAPTPPNPGCGAPPDGEGTYEDGYGYLNAYQAGLMYCGTIELGYLDGFVTDLISGDPIAGASVTAVPSIMDGTIDAITDPTGYYTMPLLPGTYDVTASKNGYTSDSATGVVVMTDTATSQDFELEFVGQWTPGPSNAPFQYNRFDGVFNPFDNLIYFPGGRTGGATHDPSIWSYDPVNDGWADTGCDMNQNAANNTAVLIDDDGTGRGEAIYVMGGYDVALAVNINTVQRYYPSAAGCLVESVATDPYPDVSPGGQVIGAGGVAEVNGKIYVFGGWESVNAYFSNKTYQFDPQAAAGSKWTELATTLSPARAYIQTAAQGDVIYAMGGHTTYTGSDLVPTSIVEALDTNNLAAGWQSRASMPVASAEGRGFGFQSDTLGLDQPAGKIYIAGGGDWPDASAEAMEYDVANDTWDQTFPDLIQLRRNHAGVYVPICTADPTDGLPGMWVFGGRTTTDDPPFGNPEYFPFPCETMPVASFTADPAMGCAPLEVQFTDTSAGIPNEWFWDFGDGVGTSTEQDPLYTYTLSGDFEVTLIMTNSLGSDTATGDVSVYQTPMADFTWSPGTVYAGEPAQFSDASTGPVAAWLWDFSDGYQYSVQNPPPHTFATTGTFTVTLTVTSGMGCADTTSAEVTVFEPGTRPYSIYLPLVIKDY